MGIGAGRGIGPAGRADRLSRWPKSRIATRVPGSALEAFTAAPEVLHRAHDDVHGRLSNWLPGRDRAGYRRLPRTMPARR
jgi:hypothetical protein